MIGRRAHLARPRNGKSPISSLASGVSRAAPPTGAPFLRWSAKLMDDSPRAGAALRARRESRHTANDRAPPQPVLKRVAAKLDAFPPAREATDVPGHADHEQVRPRWFEHQIRGNARVRTTEHDGEGKLPVDECCAPHAEGSVTLPRCRLGCLRGSRSSASRAVIIYRRPPASCLQIDHRLLAQADVPSCDDRDRPPGR